VPGQAPRCREVETRAAQQHGRSDPSARARRAGCAAPSACPAARPSRPRSAASRARRRPRSAAGPGCTCCVPRHRRAQTAGAGTSRSHAAFALAAHRRTAMCSAGFRDGSCAAALSDSRRTHGQKEAPLYAIDDSPANPKRDSGRGKGKRSLGSLHLEYQAGVDQKHARIRRT
jgi:hypothetical protein